MRLAILTFKTSHQRENKRSTKGCHIKVHPQSIYELQTCFYVCKTPKLLAKQLWTTVHWTCSCERTDTPNIEVLAGEQNNKGRVYSLSALLIHQSVYTNLFWHIQTRLTELHTSVNCILRSTYSDCFSFKLTHSEGKRRSSYSYWQLWPTDCSKLHPWTLRVHRMAFHLVQSRPAYTRS